MAKFPPPPNTSNLTDQVWRDWFYKLSVAVNGVWVTTNNPGVLAAAGGTFPMSGLREELVEGDVVEPIFGPYSVDPSTFANSIGRELLTANRTYYVRTDGSDSNDGLANTSGSAFLTIQKAIDVVSSKLDLSGYAVTIQVGDGTYTVPIVLKSVIGNGTCTLQGNTSNMDSVYLSLSAGQIGVSAAGGANSAWTVRYMKISGGNICLQASSGAAVIFNNINFGSATYHIYAVSSALIACTGPYTISAAAAIHYFMQVQGMVIVSSRTITITGTPAFSNSFLNAQSGSACSIVGNTFSGSATGVRYNISGNAVASTGGATLPGNSAGTTSTGGQYI